MNESEAAGVSTDRLPRVLTICIVAACGILPFQILLVALPHFAANHTGAFGAGGATASLMVGSVLGELVTPRLLKRFEIRTALTAGLLTLSLPSLVYLIHPNSAGLESATFVRGIGFGVVVVTTGFIIGLVADKSHPGRTVAAFGVATGVPGIFSPALGLWLVDNHGVTPVVVIALSFSVVGCIGALLFCDCGRLEPRFGKTPWRLVARDVLSPSGVVFAAACVGYGAAVTFLPSVTGRTSSWSIFALSAALVVTRWTSGRVNGWGSRKGLILLADLMIVIGLGAFFVSSVRSHSALDVIAALVFGAGFGIVTTGSYSSFLENSSSDGFLTGAVIWNIVFDAGIGFGGLATAPIAHAKGYGDVFGAVAALAVCAGVVGLNLRRRDPNSQSSSRSDR